MQYSGAGEDVAPVAVVGKGIPRFVPPADPLFDEKEAPSLLPLSSFDSRHHL